MNEYRQDELLLLIPMVSTQMLLTFHTTLAGL